MSLRSANGRRLNDTRGEARRSSQGAEQRIKSDDRAHRDPGSAAACAIRDFLYRSDVPFRWVELTSDDEARAKAGVGGLDDPRLPVCLFPDGTRFEHPTVRQITEKLGWFRNSSRSEYDLAIYGAGPAGLSAAVYGGRV